MKYGIDSNDSLFLWGFKRKQKCISWFWKFGKLALGKGWKIFDIFLKEIVLTLTHIRGFFCTQENTIVNTTDYENTKYLHMRAYA